MPGTNKNATTTGANVITASTPTTDANANSTNSGNTSIVLL